MLIKWAFK